jgi:hypothetical protein
MAQAADSPIGFRPCSKGPESSLAPQPDVSLTQLHSWQASPAGLIATHIADLVWTVIELKNLAANSRALHLFAVEMPELEWAESELIDLIARIHRNPGVAA